VPTGRFTPREGTTLPWDKHKTIKKLRQEFYGPFKILRQLGPVSFELKFAPQSHIHPVFHAHLLKATDEPGFAVGKASSLPNAADNDEYTVESSVDVRGIQGKERYLVKWSGYRTRNVRGNQKPTSQTARKYCRDSTANEMTTLRMNCSHNGISSPRDQFSHYVIYSRSEQVLFT
jgi:hypothetical protein